MIKTDKGEVCNKVNSMFTKLDRDARNAYYINDIVKEHLVWAGDKTINNKTEERFLNLRGKLPNIWVAAQRLLSEYKNGLFKSPDSLFCVDADVSENDKFADIQKSYLLSRMNDSKTMDAYIRAIEKGIWRGEAILFHEWGTIMGKKRISIPVLDKETGEPARDEDGDFKYEWHRQDYTKYEGTLVTALEPKDFVFDTSKLSAFTTSNYDQEIFNRSSCCKIKRTWMSINDIKKNPLFDKLSKDELQDLKQLVSVNDVTPRTEQNYDDFTNSFNNRVVNGDMIEILDYWGDIYIGDEFFEDYRIITAGSKVVLKMEESPYTMCPFVWMPFLLDLTTRRGLSPLLVGVDYNERATKIFAAVLQAAKFSINPAYFIVKGCTLADSMEEIKPGGMYEYSCPDGQPTPPIEIESYKNQPLTLDLLPGMTKLIDDAIGTSPQTDQENDIAKTATEINQTITSASSRIGSSFLDICNMIIVPSIEIQARMISENSEIEKEEKIKVTDSKGNKQIHIVNDQIRNGNYKYSIGSIQAIIEQKNKLSQMYPIIQGLTQLGGQFDINKLWNYAAKSFELTNPDDFMQTDPINSLPPQLKQMLEQMAGNPTQLQQVIQNGIKPPPPPPMPDVNKVVMDMAALNIWEDSKLTAEMKQMMFKMLNIVPPVEIQVEMASHQLAMKQKMQKVQEGQPAGSDTNIDLSKM
jgi:hypothetical protein